MIQLALLFRAIIVTNLGGADYRNFCESCSPAKQRRRQRILSEISIVKLLGSNLRSIFYGMIPAEEVEVTPNGIPAEQYF